MDRLTQLIAELIAAAIVIQDSMEGKTVGNQEKTDRKPPAEASPQVRTYTSETKAFARQHQLQAIGLFAGVVRRGEVWVLTHDPETGTHAREVTAP